MTNREIIESLIRKRDQLKNKINSLNETIDLLEFEDNENGVSKKLNKLDNYNPDWQLSEKIEFFLKKEQRFLYNRELAKFAHEREPEISEKEFANKFSATLSRLKRDKQIRSVQIGTSLKTTVWGAPNWIDLTGAIQEEHLPDNKYAQDSEKKKLEI